MGRVIYAAVATSVALSVGLPVAGNLLRSGRPDRCSFDGVQVSPIYRVRVVETSGNAVSHTVSFCSVECARRWVERRGVKLVSVFVTDEITGSELDVAQAFFVRSSVVSVATNGNRIHVFSDREHAEEHVRAAHGRLLDGADRPFAAANTEHVPASD